MGLGRSLAAIIMYWNWDNATLRPILTVFVEISQEKMMSIVR